MELFKQLQHKGVEADPVNFVGVLNVCTSVGALEEGKHVHEQIIQCGFVGSSLIDMYVKCGAVEDAQSVQHDYHSQFGCLECHAWRICYAWPGKESSWTF